MRLEYANMIIKVRGARAHRERTVHAFPRNRHMIADRDGLSAPPCSPGHCNLDRAASPVASSVSIFAHLGYQSLR